MEDLFLNLNKVEMHGNIDMEICMKYKRPISKITEYVENMLESFDFLNDYKLLHYEVIYHNGELKYVYKFKKSG